MVVEPNVDLEITKGVGKVVVQELHGILELVSCDHFGDNICCWNNALGGNGFHWDGGGRVGLQGGAQGVKGGYQVAEEGLKY